MVLPQAQRKFVEKLTLVTSVGCAGGDDSRKRSGYLDADRGPHGNRRRLRDLETGPRDEGAAATGVHPGAPFERTREATGRDPRVAGKAGTTDPPTEEEPRTLRHPRAMTEAVNEEPRVLCALSERIERQRGEAMR